MFQVMQQAVCETLQNCCPFDVMRPEVLTLTALGPFPAEQGALPERIATHQAALQMISRPVSDEEARVMVSLFGQDSCFGLAWSLLHLIETSPSWPLADVLCNTNNEWVARLRERAVAGGKL